MNACDDPNLDPADRPTTTAGWEPLRSDDAGNVWEWSYRDGQGTRIIVGPVERVYIERLQRVERHAREVMDYLDKYGPSIVPHLLDDDDNSGEFLRRALNGASDAT